MEVRFFWSGRRWRCVVFGVAVVVGAFVVGAVDVGTSVCGHCLYEGLPTSLVPPTTNGLPTVGILVSF